MGRSFDAGSDAGGERGPRKGFFEGDDKVRDFSSWERKGPLSPPPGAAPRQGPREPRGPPEERRASPSWGEGRSDAGSRPPRPDRPERAERPERPERAPTAADMDSQWRSRMRPDAPSPAPTPEASVPSSPQAPSAPAARPRLNLAKRTVSEAPQAEEGKTSSSIFGGAKPVDTAARDAAAEEKQREAAKARKEAEEKAREEKKAREAAKAERAADKSDKTSRENGNARPSAERKPSTNDAVPGNKQQYEILRRMNEGEGDDAPAADHDGPDASANGDIVTDKETLPQETVREVVPKDKETKGGNNWREQNQPSEPSSQALEDDGFTVVASHQKKKGRSGGRALAS